MFLRHTLLESFKSVGANATATSALLRPRKVHVVTLELGGDAANSNGLNFALQADIETFMNNVCSEIRVSVNGKTQMIGTPAQFNQLNGINGAIYLARTTGAAGNVNARAYLPIIFADIFRNNNAEVRKAAWNLSKSTPEVLIECDLNNVAAPVLQGTVEWEPADETKGLGAIRKWSRHTLDALGLRNDYDLLRLVSGDYLQSLHIWRTGDQAPRTVSQFSVKADGEDIVDSITAAENQDKLVRRQMIPDVTNGRFDWVTDYTDPLDDAIATAAFAKLKAYVTWSGAAASNAVGIIQHVGLPE